MNEDLLPKEYPIVHFYFDCAPRSPIIIKGNKEGLTALVFTIINALANSNNSSCELFDGEGEVFETQIEVAQTYTELLDET